jgi:hypothetical protein
LISISRATFLFPYVICCILSPLPSVVV